MRPVGIENARIQITCSDCKQPTVVYRADTEVCKDCGRERERIRRLSYYKEYYAKHKKDYARRAAEYYEKRKESVVPKPVAPKPEAIVPPELMLDWSEVPKAIMSGKCGRCGDPAVRGSLCEKHIR